MKRVMIVLFLLFILVNMLNIILLNDLDVKSITGSGINAVITLYIEGEDNWINITNPMNTTYSFDIGDNYTLDLNVSSSFIPVTWRYTLTDLRHNSVINSSVLFTPNTTIEAVRWSNQLDVYARISDSQVLQDSVIFYVDVPNSSPVISGINDSILVCENTYLSYIFTAEDADEDNLILNLYPSNPFYVEPLYLRGRTTYFVEMFSGNLDKNDVGIYSEIVSVSDSIYVDTAQTNITVIEVNNAPSISNIGVQTVYTQGDNSTFLKQVSVVDIEDGNQNSGTLQFSINFTGSNLFNISETGLMSYVGNDSELGVYNISVCVSDLGLSNPHEEIAFCGQDGGSLTGCNNFSLTVTNQNRPPTIVSSYPINLSYEIIGTSYNYFNLSSYDPDGTIPDVYWYLDGRLAKYSSGSLNSSMDYTFGCGVYGGHEVKAEITDGLINDSVIWSINVGYVDCPAAEEGAGGGSGGGGGGPVLPKCIAKWSCEEWSVCQNLQTSLEEGIISGDDYREISAICEGNFWTEEYWGVQLRNCFDFNHCNTTYGKLDEYQACQYVEHPSCEDGVKNCHDGACELLVDCGGSCDACATCSDGKKNQGEDSIDCGGPCPWKCEFPATSQNVLIRIVQNNKVSILLSVFASLLVLVGIQLKRINRLRKLKVR